MGMLGWVMMGLAIWHFTIWLPDRFWGGIVGALIGSLIGAVVISTLIYSIKVSGLAIPGKDKGAAARERPPIDPRALLP